jgi:hypothetical protein
MRACIRFPAIGEEIVITENVSRRGLCFQSRQGYAEGSKVEVAVPYITGAYNIFSAARILGMREESSAGLKTYRLTYLDEE